MVVSKSAKTKRLTKSKAFTLLKNAPLLELGQMADGLRRRLHKKNTVTFIVDRNINYTNICINQCKFCAFYRTKNHSEGYLLRQDDIFRKIDETIKLGGTQILLQGGLHPDLTIEYFEDLFRSIKARFNINLHAMSAPEILFLAKQSGLSTTATLARLKAAGLGSIPGAGAEILSDRIREVISPRKIKTLEWLDLMEEAHRQGIRSTATMMFGSGEKMEDIVEHLDAIRRLQDKTGGFTAFIPWTFQPANTKINVKPATGVEYLRVLAISRLYLDNISNVQASWVTQGIKMMEVSLRFGANDMGSTMIEENVVAAAGVHYRASKEQLIRAAQNAGFNAAQRDTFYRILRRF